MPLFALIYADEPVDLSQARRPLALVSRAPTAQAASTLDRGSNEAIKILSSAGSVKSHKAGYLPRSLAPRSGSCKRKNPSTPLSHDYPLGAIRQTSINDYLGARFTLPVEDDRTALAGHGLNQSGGRPPRRRDATSSTDSTPSSHDGAGVEILSLRQMEAAPVCGSVAVVTFLAGCFCPRRLSV